MRGRMQFRTQDVLKLLEMLDRGQVALFPCKYFNKDLRCGQLGEPTNKRAPMQKNTPS